MAASAICKNTTRTAEMQIKYKAKQSALVVIEAARRVLYFM